MDVLECLDQLVGVSDADCPCFEDGRPSGYDESKSNLFIGDLVDLRMMDAANSCEDGTVWDMGAKALRKASTNFQGNLLQCFADKHEARRSYIGHLAEITHTQQRKPSGVWAGIKIVPHPDITSGEIEIMRLGTVFSTTGTGTVTVLVYDQAELLQTITLDTSANDLHQNNLSPRITLPFRRDGIGHQAFYLLYEAGEAPIPRNNELICSCNSGVKNHIAQWAEVSGVQGDDTDVRSEWNLDDQYAFGLVPDVTFRCVGTDAICEGELDFASNPNAMTIAQHIQFAAAANLIGQILRSPDPNVFTLHSSDELTALRKEYQGEANARLAGLCKTMHPGSCFKCKNKGGVTTLTF